MVDIDKIVLNLPSYSYNSRVNGDALQIFDSIRRKFVQLTPEEWVRQHFINYLTEHKLVPAGLIGVEVALVLNGVNHRADIIVYDRQGNPLAVVECKAPEVELTSEVIDQIGRYNLHFKAKYLFITNGLKHYSLMVDWHNRTILPLNTIPSYKDMIG
ncbi:MAG: type I restriction enzyme HsdR N-terminal domain-containing protein [Bacteroidales bacterium]